MERQNCRPKRIEMPSKRHYAKTLNSYQNTNVHYCVLANEAATMRMLKFILFLITIAISDLNVVNCSQILVENGIYSRVTVQIEPQPQPANCVEFLDKLEVRINTL